MVTANNPCKPLNPQAQEWRPNSHKQPPLLGLFFSAPPPPVVRLPHHFYDGQQYYKHIIPPNYDAFCCYNTQLQPRPLAVEPQWTRRTTAAVCGGGSPNTRRSPNGHYEAFYRCKLQRKSRDSIWVPKKKKKSCVDISPPPLNGGPVCRRTTVMIRNVPNQYRRHMLLAFLDKLCLDQNQKAELESHTIRFEYDFVYLPMDFGRGDNLGYAFVNFTNAIAATKIWKLLQNFKWGVFRNSDGNLCQSKKVCEITWARIQGKEELVKHFRNSIFGCTDTEYLPIVLSPPRDGAVSAFQTNLGRCLPSNS